MVALESLIDTHPAEEALPPAAIASFERTGILRLRGALDPGHAERCHALVWSRLAAAGVDGPHPRLVHAWGSGSAGAPHASGEARP